MPRLYNAFSRPRSSSCTAPNSSGGGGMSVENGRGSSGHLRVSHVIATVHQKMETHFDVLMLGTGLTQSITAA